MGFSRMDMELSMIPNNGQTMSSSGASSMQNSRSTSKSSKEAPLMTELDIAYQDYLLAATHEHHARKQVDDTKTNIEAQLGFLSKRLTVDQLMLENTRRKISDINFRSDTSEALKTMKSTFTETLEHLQGETARNVSAVGAGIGAKLGQMEIKNACAGTAELKRALEESNAILDKLKDSNQTEGLRKVVNTAGQLSKIAETVREVDSKLRQVSEKLPVLQGAVVETNMIKNFTADRDQ